jgi:hypothetical protein
MAQTYKYVDSRGTVCFTDNPPSFLFKDGPAKEDPQAKQVNLDPGKPRPQIKDILQLGQEILEKELAKPGGKQNLGLIQDLGQSLYGDVSGRKNKEARGILPK